LHPDTVHRPDQAADVLAMNLSVTEVSLAINNLCKIFVVVETRCGAVFPPFNDEILATITVPCS